MIYENQILEKRKKNPKFLRRKRSGERLLETTKQITIAYKEL